MATGWLLDASAYVRLADSPDAATWVDRINRSLVHVTTLTLLEIGYAARNGHDWGVLLTCPPLSLMAIAPSTPHGERRALEVQGILARIGQHRAPAIPRTWVAAAAEVADLTVLHDHADFDLIAGITGQPVARIARA